MKQQASQKTSKKAKPSAPSVVKTSPASKRPATLGTQLKKARLAKGLSTATVAKKLRWREAHVLALESNKFETLPHGPYLKAFVQSYANLLGLDFAPLNQKLEEQFGPQTTTFAKLPKPITTHVLPTKQVVWVATGVLAAGLAVWGLVLTSQHHQVQENALEALNFEENALSLPAGKVEDILPPPPQSNN